jgi:HD-like signal output (HDOD) protein
LLFPTDSPKVRAAGGGDGEVSQVAIGDGSAVEQATVDRHALREHVRSTLTRLSRTGELPALPAAATAALAIAREPDAGVESLARVIRADVGLSARILRAANSAAYARRTPARTLAEAVLTLGLRRTCDLLVAAGARQLFRLVPRHADRLWNHALASALVAEELARTTGAADPHLTFLPGLFHDVGRIAFLLADDEAFGIVHAHVEGRAPSQSDVERAWYGFDHAEAGAILAEDWGLVHDQVEGIRWHHQPGQAEEGAALAAILNVADAGAHVIGHGTTRVAPNDAAGRERLGIDDERFASATAAARSAFAVHHDLFV